MRTGARAFVLAVLAVAIAAGHGCRGCTENGDAEVVVYTSVDQVFSEPIFRYCGTRTAQIPEAGLGGVARAGLVHRCAAL